MVPLWSENVVGPSLMTLHRRSVKTCPFTMMFQGSRDQARWRFSWDQLSGLHLATLPFCGRLSSRELSMVPHFLLGTTIEYKKCRYRTMDFFRDLFRSCHCGRQNVGHNDMKDWRPENILRPANLALLVRLPSELM
jgi:hypothetical protein